MAAFLAQAMYPSIEAEWQPHLNCVEPTFRSYVILGSRWFGEFSDAR